MGKRLILPTLLLALMVSCAPDAGGTGTGIPADSGGAASETLPVPTPSVVPPTAEATPEPTPADPVAPTSEPASEPVPSQTAQTTEPTPTPTADPRPAASVSPPMGSSPPSPTPSPTKQSPTPTPSLKPTLTPTPSLTPTPAPTPETPSGFTLGIKGPDGTLLEEEEFLLTEGMTAEQALREACDAYGMALEIRASGTKRAYLISIGGFAEKQRGAGSGWVYLHNGKQSSAGIGALKLQPGDRLDFRYTLNWGADSLE